MTNLEFVVKKLQNMNLKKVSRQVDIHYMTVYNIARGVVKNPSNRTVELLAEFLKD